jgi:hypothetical protein
VPDQWDLEARTHRSWRRNVTLETVILHTVSPLLTGFRVAYKAQSERGYEGENCKGPGSIHDGFSSSSGIGP